MAAFQVTTSMQSINRVVSAYSTKLVTPAHANGRKGYMGVFHAKAGVIHTPKILASFNGDDEDRFQPESRNTKRPKRKRQRDPIRDSVRKDNNRALNVVETTISFLSKRIPIPLMVSLAPGDRDNVEIPLVYILFIFLSVPIFPIMTWILQTGFFGIYLTLGAAFMGDNDDLGNRFDKNINQSKTFDSEEEDEYNGIIPLSAFTGAIASAALLSPQGLMTSYPFSFTSPVALIAVTLSGLTILTGIQDTRDEELRLQEKYNRELRTLEEKKQMELWDDELQRSDGRLTRSGNDGDDSG